MKYLATVRVVFDAEDDIEASLVMHDLTERASDVLDEDDSIDTTQVIQYGILEIVEPAELVNHMRHVRDMLIKTRIIQCFELAKSLDQIAWVLEHRTESTFDMTGYDYAAIFDRAAELLGRKQ
jgi:hypothetical protein